MPWPRQPRKSGLRVGLCYEVTDRNGPQGALDGIGENVRFLKRLQAKPDPKLGASFGLHASMTISDSTLEACVDAAKGLDTGFHIHIAEDKADQADSLKLYGLRVAERMEKQGILGPKTLVAHAIHVDAYEMNAFQVSKTKISHQPRSNMNNAVGVAQVEKLLDKGITVGLGNDGFYNNMFTEIHTAYLLHRVHQGDPRAMPGDRLIEMAFANNAEIADIFFPKPVGALAPGAFADIVLMDYIPVHADNRWQLSLAAHLWYGWQSRNPHHLRRADADEGSRAIDLWMRRQLPRMGCSWRRIFGSGCKRCKLT